MTTKDASIITRDDGSKMEFTPSKEGLYYYNFENRIKRGTEQKEKIANTMLVKTVEEVQRNYTKREIEAAEAACHLYVIMGHPSQKIFEEMLTEGKLLNNTVMVQDYRNALVMYGEDLGVLKGKMTKKQPEHVQLMILSKPSPRTLS
jgi:hypothetical protein